MKNLQLIKLAAIAVLVMLVILLVASIIHWQPGRTLARKQIALEQAIDSKKAKKFDKLVAKSYQDRWGYKPEDLALTMVDIRSQYILLNLTPKDAKWTIEKGVAELSVKYHVAGQPKTAVAGFITQGANKLQTPMLFTWKKQSFWPWSWQLESFDNASIPKDAYGYKPGDLSKAVADPDSFIP